MLINMEKEVKEEDIKEILFYLDPITRSSGEEIKTEFLINMKNVL